MESKVLSAWMERAEVRSQNPSLLLMTQDAYVDLKLDIEKRTRVYPGKLREYREMEVMVTEDMEEEFRIY